ncbi:hypothetical protein ACQYRI_11815 [Salmonella enterica]
MPAYPLLNGFSGLNYKTKHINYTLPCWAETQAHITLHAFLMSPILSQWHRYFRNTSLTPQPCANGVCFQYPSQLKLKDH